MNSSKRNILYSLILGEVSALFLFFVIKNPYIEEIRSLAESYSSFSWILFIALPLIFLFGVVIGELLAKIFKIFRQIVRFGEIGVLNTFIDFGVLNLLIWITGITGGMAIAPLNAASFICATTNSYFWNRVWTFGKKESATGKEFTQFLIISGIGIVINTGIIVIGTSLISPLFGLSPAAWTNVMKMIATFISMVWNFLGYKLWVFKVKHD